VITTRRMLSSGVLKQGKRLQTLARNPYRPPIARAPGANARTKARSHQLWPSSLRRMAFKEADSVTDTLNCLPRIVRYFDPEFLLEGHHELNRIQAVRA